MDAEARRVAFAEAVERSRLMLNPEACSETIAAETVTRVHRDDGFSCDWHAGMPKPAPEPAARARTLTDAEASRWQSYIDGKISAALAEHTELHREVLAAAIAHERKLHRAEVEKLRDEHDLRLSALLQATEKLERGLGGDRAADVIDMPNPLRGARRA
ncbi:hypothetical protein AB4Z51_03305 [Bradyrhizobium sp. 2TAF36]|uniref:hypothetical protein n=1 Tax=Bradyrhizobium sp. 2TAF36 TaxID=3233016 RepID=UPI003F91C5ED